jgi:1-acyl-sn-glycerol-3-phosphate acyltransferase
MRPRALLQVLAVPAATLVLGLAIILLCPFDRTGRLFPYLARCWCRVLCGTAGVRIEVEGREWVREQPSVVFVSNHLSLFDPPALLLAVPVNFRFVAKRSLFLIPVFGQALWAARIISIHRGNRERAIASMKRAALRLRAGLSILVFAEGTRSRDGRLQPLKKGAFVMALEAHSPVQPVLVSGSERVLPRGVLFARPGTIRVTFLEPVPTHDLAMSDRDSLREMVARRMQTALDGPPVPGEAVG